MDQAQLNSSQLTAVNHRNGHLLIVAGPGTGKTHTLIHRILSIYNDLIDTQNILAITFTNKAAEEMKSRLKEMGIYDERRQFVGTFHQFCLHILRTFADLSGLPNPFVVETPEQIFELSSEIWPDYSSKERKAMLEDISRWKSEGAKGEFFIAGELSHFLMERGILDFDDLLVQTVKLLKENWSVLHQIHLTYPQIFVDEYQDINPVQHELLSLLVDDEVELTAIGDPNQSIYGFRGSKVEFFQSFSDDFLGATKLSLSDNYRSGENILKASTQVITADESTAIQELTANIIAEGKLTIHQTPTEKAEAEYIVHSIEKMVGGTSMYSQDTNRVDNDDSGEYTFGEIVILYRLNAQRFALIEALERSGIPYHCSSQINDESPDEICPQRNDDVSVEGEKVSLMTIHASKGLEFPVVFITGCEDSLLPLNIAPLVGEEAEERRLFYVGMTRAKQRLYLTRAKSRYLYGQERSSPASPYLDQIEDELKTIEKQQKMKKKKQTQMSFFKL